MKTKKQTSFYLFFVAALVASLCISCSKKQEACLENFPVEADPVLVGNKLTERFLGQWHSMYGSPLRVNETRNQISYPDVCAWLGGLWFAETTKNQELIDRLEKRFDPLFTTEAYLQPKPNHVDNNVFGALPLELYLVTKQDKYKTMGMMYANTQWDLPENEDLTPEGKEWADKGYSWQTRIWVDDMFMITTVQSQAYRVTGDVNYINRAAREMVMYLDSIQRPNGLFYHTPSVPFFWGRGNGWMAAGMAELLSILPDNNLDRPAIMQAYIKMMTTLKEYQKEDGMWRQLVDDEELWEESSGSAMFTYALITGVKNKWLDGNAFGPTARKGWLALCAQIDEIGDVKSVCEGTGAEDNRQHYIDRRALTGDLHGQAPMLWCAYALVK
ncbi:hypothetical protein AGMMS50239_09520 [Bacteroidia bacterium]|nr:hypothetical protein AGMMS50239_09520 [Bacteroidia bacterium]